MAKRKPTPKAAPKSPSATARPDVKAYAKAIAKLRKQELDRQKNVNLEG
jgi:hypothetical protein